jgi:hypothetical protein
MATPRAAAAARSAESPSATNGSRETTVCTSAAPPPPPRAAHASAKDSSASCTAASGARADVAETRCSSRPAARSVDSSPATPAPTTAARALARRAAPPAPRRKSASAAASASSSPAGPASSPKIVPSDVSTHTCDQFKPGLLTIDADVDDATVPGDNPGADKEPHRCQKMRDVILGERFGGVRPPPFGL